MYATGLTPDVMASIVHETGGAMLANVISVIPLITDGHAVGW